MPEPVVIHRSTAAPAEPVVEPVPSAENADPAHEVSGAPAKRAEIQRFLRRTASRLAHGLWAASAATLRAIGRNPRMSLAAGASVLILGSIWVTQPRTKQSQRSVVTNAIGGNLFQAANDQKDPSGTKVKTAQAGHGSTTTADSGQTAAAGSGNKETAPADATPRPNLPAPSRSVDDVPLLPSLTDASTAGQTHGLTEKSPTAVELASGSKAERKPAPAPASDQRSDALSAPPVPNAAPAPSLLVAQDDKGGAKPALPAPALDPPTPALASTSQPTEPAPVPAPADQTLPLAAAPESSGNESRAARNPAPDPVANPPRHDAATAENKRSEEMAPNETRPIQNPVSGPKLGHTSKPNPSTPAPESAGEDQKRPEMPQSRTTNLLSPTPRPEAPLKANEPVEKPDAPLPSPGALVSHRDATGSAALPVEGSTSRTDAFAPQAQDIAAKAEMPAQSSTARSDSGSSNLESKERATGVAQSEPNSKSHGQKGEPETSQDLTGAGWVSIPNTGKLPVDGEENVDTRSADAGSGSESTTARDLRAHAPKNVSFELESSVPPIRSRGAHDQSQPSDRSIATSGSRQEPEAATDSARVETVPHLVERGDNFWIISRQYYNSGRYYRALWKANSDKYPDIKVLHVGDTIMIPPLDDLDRAYFLAARTQTPSAFAGPDRSLGGRGNGNRQDEAADLAVETRTVARPRASYTASPTRPVYKVRPYDTLRSIARDNLDDSRRAGEILELNRSLIDDPTHLIVGQILELPEDARTTLHRSASNR